MKPNGKPTLADVDGREPGKVQLMSIVLAEELPERMGWGHFYFEEETGKTDPWRMAEGLKLSIEGDWPDHYWAIVGNWRAQYLKWARTLKESMPFLGEEAWTPQAYLDTFE